MLIKLYAQTGPVRRRYIHTPIEAKMVKIMASINLSFQEQIGIG